MTEAGLLVSSQVISIVPHHWRLGSGLFQFSTRGGEL